MDWDDALPWFLVVLLTAIAMAVRSLVADRRLKSQLEALASKVAMYEHRLFRLDERGISSIEYAMQNVAQVTKADSVIAALKVR